MSQTATPQNDQNVSVSDDEATTEKRELSEAAKRALAEAEARRAARDATVAAAPKEVGGAVGPDPARYGDWEKDGIASDF